MPQEAEWEEELFGENEKDTRHPGLRSRRVSVAVHILTYHEYERSSFPLLQLTRRRSGKREQNVRAKTSQEFSIAAQVVLLSYLILPYDIEGQKNQLSHSKPWGWQ